MQALAQLDVLHYELHLDVPDFRAGELIGDARLKVTFTQTVPKKLALDLKLLDVEAAEWLPGGGASYPEQTTQARELVVFQEEEQVQFQAPAEWSPQDTLWLRLRYRGVPAAPDRFGGFYFEGNYAWNLGVWIGGDNPAYGRAWFPCRDNFTDKATYRQVISGPPGFHSVGNGVLIRTEELEGGRLRTTWDLQQPIPTYLAAVAIGDFAILRELYISPVTGDSIPVSLHVPPADSLNARKSFARLKKGIEAFERFFGPYRWGRIGYAAVPMQSGAMEHATNVAYPQMALTGTDTYDDLWAHELSHSWFGNLVTCQGPDHMWLNEGFARYCETLFFEAVSPDPNAAATHLRETHARAILASRLEDYAPLFPSAASSTYSSTIYNKGALAVHNLRYLYPQAESSQWFFAPLRNYLAANAWGNVGVQAFEKQYLDHLLKALQKTGADTTSAELPRKISSDNRQDSRELQQRLAAFFKTCVYAPGWLDARLEGYTLIQTDGGYHLQIDLQQVRDHTPAFSDNLPVELLLLGEHGEHKYITVALQQERQRFAQQLSFRPVEVFLDPRERYAGLALQHLQPLRSNDSTYNYPHTGFHFRCNTLGADTALLQAAQYHSSPGRISVQGQDGAETALYVSINRYWSINSTLGENANGAFHFRFRNTSGLFSSRAIPGPEKELVLLHRAEGKSHWNIVPTTGLLRAEESVAYFETDILEDGLYTVGYKK